MKNESNAKLDAMEEKTIRVMDTMPQHQQEKLLDFWGGFQNFFTDFIGWIGRAWNKVVEAIKAAWVAVKTVVTGIFKGICKALSFLNPFNW